MRVGGMESGEGKREGGRFQRASLTQRAKRRGTLITDVFCGHWFFYSFFSFFFVFRGHGL